MSSRGLRTLGHPVAPPSTRTGSLLVGLAGVVALALLAGPLAPRAGAYDLTLSTGEPGGTYHALGEAIGRLVTEKGQIIKVAVQASPGSLGNVRRLASGKADFALVQEDILLAAVRGDGGFAEPILTIKALGRLYEETVHLVTKLDEDTLGGLDELAGLRIGLGAQGSGTLATAQRLLGAVGLSEADVKAMHLGSSASLEALQAGKLDAFFVVGAAPTHLVQEALAGGARLVPIEGDEIDALEEEGWLHTTWLSGEDYPGLAADDPEAEVATVSVDAILCARDAVPADVVFEALELCASNTDRLAAACALLEGWTPEDAQEVPAPLHPGAVRFYYERNVVQKPVRVFTGIYVHDIHHFDLKTQSFDVEAGVWMRWRGRLADDEADLRFRFIDGEINRKELVQREHFGGWTYVYYEVAATLRGRFLLHKYPFDTQHLVLQVQHERLDATELTFVPDEATVHGERRDLMKSLAKHNVEDWQVAGVSQSAQLHTFETDFGSPVREDARAWSRYEFRIEVRRLLVPYLMKFSLPLVLIALMAYSNFFIHPDAYETKILVVIWVLFTAVEFHVYQSDALPEIGYMVTADKFFLWTYVSVFLALAHTIVTDAFHHRENMVAVRKLQRWAFALYPVVFFGPIGYLIWTSL